MHQPLLTWTRPLTAAERTAERKFEAPLNLALAFSTTFVPSWPPVLPGHVAQCRICKVPHRKDLCAGCRKLGRALGWPVESLEMLTYSQKMDDLEHLIWAWKEQRSCLESADPPDAWLATIGNRLAAYLHAHAARLFSDEPLLTTVPSRAPLVATALAQAADAARSSLPRVIETGAKAGVWFQHGSDPAERLTRRADDWTISQERVSGRPIVLIDDVFVTGASLFSYAHALRHAGAATVRAVAITRHLRSGDCNYFDALRIVRHSQDWTWSAERASVAYGPDPIAS